MKKCGHELRIHGIHETTCFLVVKVILILSGFLPFQHVTLLFLTKKKLKVRNWWEGNTVITVFAMSYGRLQKTAGIHMSPACLKVSLSVNSGPNDMKLISASFCLVESSCFHKEYGDDLFNTDCYRFVSYVMDIQWVTGLTESKGSHSKEHL